MRPSSSSRSPSTVAPSGGGRGERRTSSPPRASKITAGPPISEASASATPSSPRSESTMRSSRSWADSARWSPAQGGPDRREPLVGRQRALEHRVVLVDEVRGRLLGDRDERQLVGHLDEREAQIGGRLPPRV